jgi:lysophospholipase L1-like esterase
MLVRKWFRSLAVGIVVVLPLGLVGCSDNRTAASSAQSSSSSSSPGQLYVSVGDSYAAGYQPSGPHQGSTTRNGFAYQVVPRAKARGYDLQLVNFGCGGATTTSILQSPGCSQLGPDGQNYSGQPQAAAADDFLRTNRGRVALITVSVGGNDVTKCATQPDPVTCVTSAVAAIKTNLSAFVHGLRDAAGPDVPIVGITYPDVVLGAWVTGQPAAQNLAKLSVTAFQSLINPALQQQYQSVGGTFVDVTAASGAYGSLDETTTFNPYGVIPVPVAKVCQLTFFCQYQDIHPTNDGYALIADLIAQSLPQH